MTSQSVLVLDKTLSFLRSPMAVQQTREMDKTSGFQVCLFKLLKPLLKFHNAPPASILNMLI